MRFLTSLALLASAPALAAETDAEADDLLLQARQQRTRGWAGIGGGLALVGGGFAVMTVGRPSSEVSTEDPTVYELRSMTGIGLFLGGVTSVILGTDSLRKARASKQAALSVTPDPVARGAGLRLDVTF